MDLKNKEPRTESEITEDLMKKVALLADKVKNTKNPNNATEKEILGKTFSEMLYMTFILAEHHNVNLEESLMQTIDEYVLGFVS